MGIWRSCGDLFRKYLVAGLLVVIPLVGTIWILKIFVFAVEDFFLGLLPAPLQPEEVIGFRIPGVGLAITVVLILCVGILTRLLLARQMIRIGEGIMARIPVGRAVYHGIKQLMQLILGQAGGRFSRVVLVEFFQPGAYLYGFVTGEAPGNQIFVFVPTTPNPTTGFLLQLPAERTRPCNLSVDAAMKLVISGGLTAQSTADAPSP